MYSVLLPIHHYLAFAAIIALFVSIGNALFGFFSTKNYNSTDKTIMTSTVGIIHLQVLVGIILWAVSPTIQAAMADMGAAMKDASTRGMLLEHPTMGILSSLCISIASVKSKKAMESKGKFKNIIIFAGLALVMVLSRLPWERLF